MDTLDGTLFTRWDDAMRACGRGDVTNAEVAIRVDEKEKNQMIEEVIGLHPWIAVSVRRVGPCAHARACEPYWQQSIRVIVPYEQYLVPKHLTSSARRLSTT
jgi:hypothetical protein